MTLPDPDELKAAPLGMPPEPPRWLMWSGTDGFVEPSQHPHGAYVSAPDYDLLRNRLAAALEENERQRIRAEYYAMEATALQERYGYSLDDGLRKSKMYNELLEENERLNREGDLLGKELDGAREEIEDSENRAERAEAVLLRWKTIAGEAHDKVLAEAEALRKALEKARDWIAEQQVVNRKEFGVAYGALDPTLDELDAALSARAGGKAI